MNLAIDVLLSTVAAGSGVVTAISYVVAQRRKPAERVGQAEMWASDLGCRELQTIAAGRGYRPCVRGQESARRRRHVNRAEHFQLMDNLSLLQQLGVIPQQEPAAANTAPAP